MVSVFTVVGERQDDPARLLVLGADGAYYDYVPARERFTRVEPDRAWIVYGRSVEGEGAGAVPNADEDLDPAPVAARW